MTTGKEETVGSRKSSAIYFPICVLRSAGRLPELSIYSAPASLPANDSNLNFPRLGEPIRKTCKFQLRTYVRNSQWVHVHTHMHPHLGEQQASSCMNAPFIRMTGTCANGAACPCIHLLATHAEPSPFPLAQSTKPETLGNFDISNSQFYIRL